MAKRLGFKPTVAEQKRMSLAASKYYASMAPHWKGAIAAAQLEKQEAGIKPKQERAAPRQLEAPVLQAICELLQAHPNVILAIRQNSGAASYSAANGSYAPVWFYRWVKRPEKMRLPDVWGLLKSGVPYWIEVKRPEWKQPGDDREREQAAFLRLMVKAGHRAGFARSVDEAASIVDADG